MEQRDCALCEAFTEAGGVVILALLFAAWFWGIVHYPLAALVGGVGAAFVVVAAGRWSRSHRHRH